MVARAWFRRGAARRDAGESHHIVGGFEGRPSAYRHSSRRESGAQFLIDPCVIRPLTSLTPKCLLNETHLSDKSKPPDDLPPERYFVLSVGNRALAVMLGPTPAATRRNEKGVWVLVSAVRGRLRTGLVPDEGFAIGFVDGPCRSNAARRG